MPLRITQKECSNDLKFCEVKGERNEHAQESETVLKVEGCLYLEDAELLERICHDLGDQTKRQVRLDLADLSFLDSESASVLCRLRREQGVTLEGLQLFIAKVIELTEAEASASKYLHSASDAPKSGFEV